MEEAKISTVRLIYDKKNFDKIEIYKHFKLFLKSLSELSSWEIQAIYYNLSKSIAAYRENYSSNHI